MDLLLFNLKAEQIVRLYKVSGVLFFVLLSQFSTAKNEIVLLSRTEYDRIKLRWSPKDLKNIKPFSKTGYLLVRKNDSTTTSDKIITIKPFPKDHLYWKTCQEKKSIGYLLYELLYNEKDLPEVIIGFVLLKCDQDSTLATAAGLFYSDTTIQSDINYSYKIIHEKSQSSSAEILVNAIKLSVLPPIDFTLLCKNKKAVITIHEKPNRNHYSAYQIERSNDSIEFNSICKEPLVQIINEYEKDKEKIWYYDSLENPQQYYYRCFGITYFGTKNKITTTKSCFLYPDFIAGVNIDSIFSANKKIQINFSHQNDLDKKLVQNYFVESAENFTGPFTIIYDAKIVEQGISFQENSVKDIFYYRIGIIHLNSDTIYTWPEQFSRIDTIPPLVPVFCFANIDRSGIVNLKWESFIEDDVAGYKLFRRNSEQEEFMEISKNKLTTTAFIDTLSIKNLERKVHYCLAAYDERYNTSQLSEIITILKPDIIPPIPAQISNAIEKNGIVSLDIVASSSSDVSHYVVLKEPINSNSEKIKLYTYSKNFNSHIDTSSFESLFYYSIITYDSSGNFSESKKIMIKTILKLNQELILSGISHLNNKNIELNWNYTNTENSKLIIYRSKNEIDFTPIKTVYSKYQQFIDTEVSPGNKYYYKIAVKLENGTTIFSPAIMVQY